LTCEFKGRARGALTGSSFKPRRRLLSFASGDLQKEGSKPSSRKAARHVLVSKKTQEMKNAYRKRILERAKSG
jgi:hypothetical protein